MLGSKYFEIEVPQSLINNIMIWFLRQKKKNFDELRRGKEEERKKDG